MDAVCSKLVVYGGEDIVLWCKKVKPVDAVDAVCSGRIRIVVYGGGTLSFMQKGQTKGCSGCSMQWNSDIWWWGHCFWCKKVKQVDAVCSGHSGIVIYGGGDIVFDTKRSNQRMQWIQWMQYAVDAVE